MKKYLLTLALLAIFTPSIALASWWNPLSWFNNWHFSANRTSESTSTPFRTMTREEFQKEYGKYLLSSTTNNLTLTESENNLWNNKSGEVTSLFLKEIKYYQNIKDTHLPEIKALNETQTKLEELLSKDPTDKVFEKVVLADKKYLDAYSKLIPSADNLIGIYSNLITAHSGRDLQSFVKEIRLIDPAVSDIKKLAVQIQNLDEARKIAKDNMDKRTVTAPKASAYSEPNTKIMSETTREYIESRITEFSNQIEQQKESIKNSYNEFLTQKAPLESQLQSLRDDYDRSCPLTTTFVIGEQTEICKSKALDIKAITNKIIAIQDNYARQQGYTPTKSTKISTPENTIYQYVSNGQGGRVYNIADPLDFYDVSCEYNKCTVRGSQY